MKLSSLFIVLLFPLSSTNVEAEDEVSFRRDIVPILTNSCIKCHSGDEAEGELNLTSSDGLLAGGASGDAIVIGKAEESLIYQLASGQDEDRIMPANGPRLTPPQLALLKLWIDTGAQWDSGLVLKGLQQAELKPRRPELPNTDHTNPIDRILSHYNSEHNNDKLPIINDSRFIRRVHLDLIGTLPTPEEVQSFITSTEQAKRTVLIDNLLNRNKEYTEHWLTFWNDILRNAYIGTGYIDGGRKSITDWLYKALYNNKRYNEFAHELLNPSPESEGFVRGIIWRGVVNASQKREMQAAQNVSQVFLGTNLKCASCHDSYINHWKLADAYGLAAVFATEPLEIHKCNKPIGEFATPKFIYSELGTIDPNAPPQARMKQLADLMISPDNGRFTRTMVNRLWAQLMGRGIIEPVDDMDQPAWNQDLLDWLAVDLSDNGYDVKHTLRQIVTSRAYQREAVGAPAPDETEFVFRGPIVKRMTAEQFVDAVNAVTQTWATAPAIKLPPITPDDPQHAHDIQVTANWIWDKPDARVKDTGGTVYFRKNFEITEAFTKAVIAVTCDNGFRLFVNSKKLAESDNWSTPQAVDITRHLKHGKNTIAIHGYNFPDKVTGKGLSVSGANAAGLVASIALERPTEDPDVTIWTEIKTDNTWVCNRQTVAGWETVDFDDSLWQKAATIGTLNVGPWNIATGLQAALLARTELAGHSFVRTSLLNDDILTRALGRPNREQVITRRNNVATTLQAIELTNGDTLDDALKAGAKYWAQQSMENNEQLIRTIFETGLTRKASPTEIKVALSLLSNDNNKEQGIEDILWILTMLPEFQLIY
tara:strand:+ start:1486 stop:3951 length:2466 start_codon:yes stop_codon:yes gene_type:complete